METQILECLKRSQMEECSMMSQTVEYSMGSQTEECSIRSQTVECSVRSQMEECPVRPFISCKNNHLTESYLYYNDSNSFIMWPLTLKFTMKISLCIQSLMATWTTKDAQHTLGELSVTYYSDSILPPLARNVGTDPEIYHEDFPLYRVTHKYNDDVTL